ncbi:hypothetical protein KBZ21_38635, partial [Streptomyces sp. A73]|nr:hypothetical protein [Streptomyces sp. A73]
DVADALYGRPRHTFVGELVGDENVADFGPFGAAAKLVVQAAGSRPDARPGTSTSSSPDRNSATFAAGRITGHPPQGRQEARLAP